MSMIEIILFVLCIILSAKIIILRKWLIELREYTDRNIDEIVKILEERVKK